MAIILPDATYLGLARLQPMAAGEAQEFRLAFDSACEKIRSCTIGSNLLDEIAAATPDLRIVKPGNGEVNSCVPDPQTEQARNAACYVEVISDAALREKIQSLARTGKMRPDHAAVRKYMKFRGKESVHIAHVRDYHVPIAHKPKDDRTHSTDDILRNRINLLDDRKDVEEAVGFVTALQNGLIAYHIMEHLTPGPGTGAYVVWNPDDQGADAGDGQERAPWMHRPTWVSLAHELIHGWRLVTGRCVFRPEARIENYYEEAMTVGLPPYDGCAFTENRFRHVKGMPLRTFYGASTRQQSERAQRKHGALDARLL